MDEDFVMLKLENFQCASFFCKMTQHDFMKYTDIYQVCAWDIWYMYQLEKTLKCSRLQQSYGCLKYSNYMFTAWHTGKQLNCSKETCFTVRQDIIDEHQVYTRYILRSLDSTDSLCCPSSIGSFWPGLPADSDFFGFGSRSSSCYAGTGQSSTLSYWSDRHG